MQAMQYEITLPADYDMRIIRERVAIKGHLLDRLPGLGFKAYLIRERGRGEHAGTPAGPGADGGPPVNQYAPFYLWRSTEAMAGFLRGPGFAGLSADFGRPPVRHWIGTGLRLGPERELTPRTATRRTLRLAEGADPDEAAARALAELPDRPGLHSVAVALDPYRWELLRFALWRQDNAPADGGHTACTAYQVLHLSRPELDALPTTEKD
ncbi:DUF4865 family protein [Kitasatospora sp. NPDC056138]|uniref:DUF4865 family protein n=1 Tax=Kitasatospora sp. NPDC056138 TaxID=3345724 RepID=UPI0035E06306